MTRLLSAATLAVACLPALCAGQASRARRRRRARLPRHPHHRRSRRGRRGLAADLHLAASGADGGPGAVHSTPSLANSTSASPNGSASPSTTATRSRAPRTTRPGPASRTSSAPSSSRPTSTRPHEFIVSLGVIREFGRTGTAHIGADEYGNTTPTIYFGKGLGDLPIGLLRPLAITGTGGFAIADKELKACQAPVARDRQRPGRADRHRRAAIQQRLLEPLGRRPVRPIQHALPAIPGARRRPARLSVATSMPLVELAYSSPASAPSNLGTQLVVRAGRHLPGRPRFQFGIEALIPANRASGSNVGVIAQFHLFFDDLFPNSLGKPLLDF